MRAPRPPRLIAGVTAVAALLLSGLACGASPATTTPASSPSAPQDSTAPQSSADTAPRLHVSGNKLLDASGKRVILHGVDRSGGEYACVQGQSIWIGPMNQASVTAMKSWGINAVRIPLNEACWNGESYVNSAYSGSAYRSAVQSYVQLLNSNGIVAILDLHLTDGQYTGPDASCSSANATCEKPMPDKAQAVPFWTSVAQMFKNNDSVVFDLFNEPYPQAFTGSEASGWRCWLNGGSDCPGLDYQAVGMQSLVNTVRATGARNVIMAAGIGWANDLSQWLKYKPSDPDHNLAASWHSYNFNPCNSATCWDSQVAPVIAKVPVIVGEMGELNCSDNYIDPLMKWLDSESTSYLAWAWNTNYTCAGGPSLITNYNGTPTAYGSGFQSHLRSLH
jgi:endoglucanase